MISFFRNKQDKRLRHDAENWLRLADKVYHYRRDLISEHDLNRLTQASLDLREHLKPKQPDHNKVKLALDRLEGVIRQVGGSYYPKSAVAENIEVLLVAAILAIGIRTYFIQPFKIPTNSMKPTYYGMTAEVFGNPSEEPGMVRTVARKALFGASRVAVDAAASGVCYIPFDRIHRGGFDFRHVPDRNWIVFPTVKKEYSIIVDNRAHHFRVPADFQVEEIYREVFFPEYETLTEAIQDRFQNGRYHEIDDGRLLIETDREVSGGERILAFDILTGDQLFVDRISYHFVRPHVGESIVFRTGEIEGLGGNDDDADSYYIKRMVGAPGDRLEIREPVLYRNDEPINTRPVFEDIHERKGKYGGYIATGLLGNGAVVEVPERKYFALGDNSGNSLDSRNFGFVPEHSIVGRPVFIYYPFTSRWGRAR